MPRVISGQNGGIRLRAPEGLRTRPTADRVKEGMFSALVSRADLKNARVLELYAGSGQLGIEFLSRGAAHCTFVERQAAVLAILRENLKRCGLADRADVLRMDARAALHKLSDDGQRFDFLIADPPYADAPAFMRDCAHFVRSQTILEEGAWLIFEHALASPAESPEFEGLCLRKRCQYGSTMISFYQFSGAEKDLTGGGIFSGEMGGKAPAAQDNSVAEAEGK